VRPWRIIRFEDFWDSGIGWSIPETDYEWQSGGGSRVPTAAAVGRDYAVDVIGWARSPKEPAIETIRCTLSAPDPAAAMAQWDALQRVLDRIGRGRLIAERPDGSRVWALARLRQAPNWTVSAYSWLRQPLTVQFIRLSHWYADSEQSASWQVVSSTQDQTLSIAGTAATDRIVMRLTAGASGGYAAPTIADMMNGASLTVGVTAPVAGAILEIDCYARTARQSTDGGSTWTDVTASVDVPAYQVSWFEMRPDTAKIRLSQSSSPNCTLQMTWIPAYAG